ncbi:DNA-directed DNA/RNA polymerase mu isoform X1 [Hemiscyllium ocellatum]|uniref:DNA-directed DNA/RNA polymerase mu isoform X1 n=2 Tax=Hemiscyllium ocellatum TaxID=170820 RepID=UPI0029665BB8|nr:DNA-directed DNA/RNA polymerase mu isoform X1 [Hemiscyllium ocellatum]
MMKSLAEEFTMALLPRKKRRKDPALPGASNSRDGDGPVVVAKFSEVGIFLVERKMGSSRRNFLTQLAQKKGFRVEEQMSESVTHVVSENNSGDEVFELLAKQSGICRAALVDMTWFTESMAAGKPLEIENRHRLQVNRTADCSATDIPVSQYACQRRTTLNNRNNLFTDALKILAEHAELCENGGRNLAFTRASSILKSLPYRITKMDDLQGIPSLGEHSKKVIKEILEDGNCREVEKLIQNERYQTLKRFTSIFGVGVKTAEKWYREGLRTLHELKASKIKLTKEQEAGLLYYEDLIVPVTMAEADSVRKIVEETVHRFLPAAVIKLAGGFRRGKESGHDVDLLITHQDEGKEQGLLHQVINWMAAQGMILYDDITDNRDQKWKTKEPEIFDHFAKCYLIFKLQKDMGNVVDLNTPGDHDSLAVNEAKEMGLGGQAGTCERASCAAVKDKDWKAIRVDLVVAPFSQYAYALLGWTGSRLFERDLRRYAKHFKHMSLSSHSLFDNEQKRFLMAATEEEIFAHLGLDYIPPQERNA